MRDMSLRSAIALCVALTLAACTDTAEPTTTTSSPAASTTTSISATTTTTIDPLLRLALPIDPEVMSGTLDNGLTYYLRENDSPGGRAELRLLVDVGSVQETDDQAGIAHFLEHMMFNGTERFPRNELIAALESFGPRFGPDINAHTNYDETVYELSLSTADEELVQLGVDVLREWATRATLTETDVVEERGVVLDEWRVRAQGFGARVSDELQSLVLEGSVYEGRQPIGTAESIEGTTPEALREFYATWYRPDRMAVVAVGDFDLAEMESRIVEAFGDIEPADSALEWDQVTYEPPGEPRAGSLTDEEATGGGVSVIWPVSGDPMATVGDYQGSVAASLGVQILNDRLSDDALLESGPVLGSSTIDFEWTRAVDVIGVDAELRAKLGDEGLERVLVEVERIRREGITDEEFDRVMTSLTAFSQQGFDQQESAQDVEFAAQIAAHHLDGSHLMGPAQRFEIESDIIDRLTRSDVEEAIVALMDGAPVVFALGPDDQDAEVPDEARILEVLASLDTVTLESRDDIPLENIDLMPAPEPAEIVDTTVDPTFDFTTLQFANGADVYLWESDIATESVYVVVEGFGGTSLIELADLPEAYVVTDVVGRSGIGDFDVPTLRRLFADRIVSLQPWLSETRQGLEGASSATDVETLFQLIHLTMSQPRFDQNAVEAVLDEIRSVIASRGDLPGLLFEEAVNEAYYGEDPRYFVIPSAEEIEEFDIAAAQRVYGERFGDAGDFAYAFVGDFDSAELADLAARYIGTLPGDPAPSEFVDNQPLPPREVQVATVEAGVGDQGQVGMFFTNEIDPVLRDRVAARLTESILTTRLRERVREELSASYSIFAAIDLQRDPDPFAEALVISTGDPAGLDQISEEVVAEIAALQGSGPTEAEFQTAVAQLRDDLDLIDNGILARALITAHLYPDQPVSEISEQYQLLDEVTPEDVRVMAATVYDLDQRIEVRQMPRNEARVGPYLLSVASLG